MDIRMKIYAIVTLLMISFSSNSLADNKSTIDFSSVSTILQSVKEQPTANVSKQGGWEIVSLIEEGNQVIWFFAPLDHAAYPALVKKTIRVKGKGIETEINTLCEASKPKCNSLIEQFRAMNEVYK